MGRVGRTVTMLIVAVLLQPSVVAAARCRPDDYALSGRSLGSGWTQTQPAEWWREPGLELDFSSIDEIEAYAYTGPSGAVVSTIVVVPNDSVTDRATSIVTVGAMALFGGLQIGVFDVDQLGSSVDANDAPAECQSFVTSAVSADAFGLPAAIGQCRLEDEVNTVLIALVRGEVAGLEGADVARSLVEEMIDNATRRGCD